MLKITADKGISQEDLDKQILVFLGQGQKMEAVRFARDAKKWGLCESKDYVEEMQLKHSFL